MNGFILLDKPKGITSHQALQVLKRKLKPKDLPAKKFKIGHTGTLDPFATGLLVVGVGEALKFLTYLHEEPKVYEAKLKLGESTDTLDEEGEIQLREPVPDLNSEIIQSTMNQMLGEQEQIPPMYSAKKIQGRKLYELARQGKEIERKPVKISVSEFKLIQWQKPYLEFRVACSKGTYVRSLGADLAVKLGTQGHLVELRRVRSGDFFLDENSVHLDSSEIPEFLPPEKFLEHYPKVQLNRDQAKAIQLGQKVKLERDLEFISEKNEVTLWCDSKFLGMGVYEKNLLQAKRLLAVNSVDSELQPEKDR